MAWMKEDGALSGYFYGLWCASEKRCTFATPVLFQERLSEKMRFSDCGALGTIATLPPKCSAHNWGSSGARYTVFKVWVRHVCCIIFDVYRICYLLKCCTVIVAIYVHFTLVLFFQCDIIITCICHKFYSHSCF